MQTSLSRRRFIAVSAAAAGLPLLPFAAGPAVAREPMLHVWRGVVLGADAVLQIHHPDPAAANRFIRMALTEAERLERIFSLYRPDSALVQLNREGRLDVPPADLVRLLSTSVHIGDSTDGAFDVTIQPLWQLYAEHFGRRGCDPNGPSHAAIESALARVGYRAIEIAPALIRFERPGMAITLNGIAQGYVTDRVVDILGREGLTSALVDMGEIRAMGSRPDGSPWRIGLEDPLMPGQTAERISVVSQAVATSGGYGLQFDAAGRFNHLLDPASGASAQRYLAVSVLASNATIADALSTALTFMPLDRVRHVAKAFGIEAHFAMPDGSRIAVAA